MRKKDYSDDKQLTPLEKKILLWKNHSLKPKRDLGRSQHKWLEKYSLNGVDFPQKPHIINESSK